MHNIAEISLSPRATQTPGRTRTTQRRPTGKRHNVADIFAGVDWCAGSNAPYSPGGETPSGGLLRWKVGDGARYAVLSSLSGGVVWMRATLEAPASTLDIEFDVRNIAGPECCVPILYAGRKEPYYPAFFATDFIPIDSGWQRRTFTLDVPIHHQHNQHQPASPYGVVIAIGFADPSCERAEVPAGQQVAIANLMVSPK